MATAVEPNRSESALARFDDVRQLMAQFDPAKFIPLIPSVFQERSDLYRPAVVVVPVDPTDKRDVYESPAKDGTVCLRARKAEQIGNAIGVKWHDVKMERTDTSVTATVKAEITDAVGDRIPLVAIATEYLTPAKGRTVSTFPEEKAQARARAILIKKLTGLPTSFTPAELKAKDFVGLRWVLDDRQPDIRDAVINRGLQAAAHVFGKEAPQKAIEAVAGPDDQVIEGQLSEVGEPEIPDAPPATAAAPAFDIQAVRAALEVLRSKQRTVDGRASDDLLQEVGVALRDVLELPGRVDKAQWTRVRLAMLTALWGIEGSSRNLTAHQGSATLQWLNTDEGRAQARALFDVLAQSGDFPVQQTLGASAEALR